MSEVNPRQLFSDPRLFVASWFNQHGIKVHHGDLTSSDPKLKDRSIIEITMWLDYEQQLAAYNATLDPRARIGGFKEASCLKAVSETIAHALAAERAQAIAAIAFDPQLVDRGTEQLANWVAAVEQEPQPLTVAVMQHWLWMIKRKLAGLEVVHHIVPILCGASQGKGKSTAIKRLFSPVRALSKELDASFFTDERKAFTFGDTYVGFLDELADLKRAELASVKRIITLESLAARKMNTNNVYNVPQNTSFIGTSNTSVGLIVNDTQMRRFYEINAASNIDWNAVNSVDYLAVFKAIDPNKATGYLAEHLEALYMSQSELATPEPLQMFVEEYDVRPGKHKQLESSKLYEKYREWCEENGMNPLNSAWFTKRFKALGFEQKKLRKKKVFWFSEDSALGVFDLYKGPATVHKIGGEEA